MLAILGALSLPLTAQVSNHQTKQVATEDVSAILNRETRRKLQEAGCTNSLPRG